MRFSIGRIQKSVGPIKRNRSIYTKTIITFSILSSTALVLGSLSPVLFPGGWGLSGSQSVSTKFESTSPKGTTQEITLTDNPGKTVWDWLSLLGVPLSIALLGIWFQVAERNQSLDEMREEALQTYFDRISALLLDRNLLSTVADIVRARTLSILRRFEEDEKRKTSVVRFLLETGIIHRLDLDFSTADLRRIDLSGAELGGTQFGEANLENANLCKAKLRGACFYRAKLIRANLFGAELHEAKLQGADLTSADLVGSKLQRATLSHANLSSVNLTGAALTGATFHKANFSGSSLVWANLNEADLSEATLKDTDLRNASLHGTNLRGAKLKGTNLLGIRFDNSTQWPTKEEVKQAKNIPSAVKLKLKI